MKNVVLQNEDTRYKFEVIPETKTCSERVSVTCEKKLMTGHGTMSHDYMSVERSEEKLKKLLEDGYIKFRTVHEVSWYATRPNNTPYEEIWEVKEGFFIPKESHSVSVTTINGQTYELADLWGKGISWPTKYYIGKDASDKENGCYYAKAVISDGEYKGTYCFMYKHYPDRGEVEDDLLDVISGLDGGGQKTRETEDGGYYIVTF